MSALDYVREKQNEHPPANNWSEVVDDLWSRLGTRIPLFIREMKDEGRLAFGATSEEGPRIYIHYLPESHYGIMIHQDLPHLIYRITRAAVSQLTITAGGVEFPANVELKKFTQVVADILWWFQQTGTVTGPEYSVNQHQITFAGMLAIETESFLLAHELGHLMVNPGADIHAEHLIEQLISGTFAGFLPQDASRWEEEFYADIAGFRLVMGITTGQVSTIGAQNQLRYAGVELMLLIEHAMEQLGFPISSTHPPAQSRLKVLREYARSLSRTAEQHQMLTGIAQMFERLLMDAIHRVIDPGEDAASYQAESDQAVNDLNSYVDEYAKQSPPDYFLFYQGLDRILGQGYYHVILEKIADYVRDLMPSNPAEMIQLESLRIAGKDLSESEESRLSDYRKFKLILGYFERRSDPIGRYMMQVVANAAG